MQLHAMVFLHRVSYVICVVLAMCAGGPRREPSADQSRWLTCHLSLIADRPFFAGQALIPNLPHVIIVPNSLVNQWYSELRTFYAPGTIEIYRYPSAEAEFGDFWGGHWATSNTPLIHRIILVTHSVSLCA
jgi:hypothetical protein